MSQIEKGCSPFNILPDAVSASILRWLQQRKGNNSMDRSTEAVNWSEIADNEGWMYIHPQLKELYAGSDTRDFRGRDFKFKTGESEIERIQQRLNDESFRQERQEMKKNFEDVIEKFQSGEFSHLDIVAQFREVFLAVKDQEVVRRQFDAQKTQEVVDRLFAHLDQTQDAFTNILQAIESIRQKRETPPYTSEQETPKFLTTRQRLLLTKVIAPLHDLAKLLGSMNQIDPDHENVMEYLLVTFGKGQFFLDDEGNKITLNDQDVEFVALAVSSHEDIYREEWFADRATAMHEELNQEPNYMVALDRGMSVFHISDILGDVAQVIGHGDGTGAFTLDFEKKKDGEFEFDTRFLDLYQRHMQLDGISGWDRGKAWRPEWGVYAIKSLIETAQGLEQFGVKMEEGLVGRIREKMVSKIDQALAAIQQAGKTEELIAKVEELKKARQMMEKIGSEDISFHVTQSLLPTRGGNMSAETPTEAMAAEAVQAPEKQEEIVDPEEWYEELEEAGYPKVMLKKIALVKMRIVTQDEEGQEAIVSQDKTSSKKIVGEVMIQNVHADGTEHEGEKEYGFGNKKDTLPKRNQDFHDKYEEIPDMKGYFRKKGDQAVVGIQVPVTKRIKVNWTDKGAEIKVGGYLINGGKDNYYPINPDSLWGYEILEKEDDDD